MKHQPDKNMNQNHRIPTVIFTLLLAGVFSSAAFAAEPVTLIGTIVKWRYPDAEIQKSEMSDAATMDSTGERTVASTLLKTTMMTSDPIDKVMAFYRKLLTRNVTNDQLFGNESSTGRSVLFSDESDHRPFKFHTILVNESDKSTTLLITRAEGEDHTHITWKQYLKHSVKE